MATFHQSLGKKVKDLLNKNFATGFKGSAKSGADIGVKFEAKTTATNGVELTSTLAKNPDGSTQAVFNGKYKEDNFSVETGYNTDKDFSTEAVFADAFTKGLELSGSYNVSGKGTNAKLSGKYQHDHFATSLDVTNYFNKGLNVVANGSLAVKNGATTISGSAKYHALSTGNKLENTEVKVDYETDSYVATFFTLYEEEQNTTGFSYHQNINENVEGAVEYTLVKEGDYRTDPILVAGVKCSVDDATTVKAKMTFQGATDNRLAIVFKKQISDDVVVELGGDLNLKTLLDVPSERADINGHKFGLNITLN
eukprot:TRINITY_DN10867_c0_g1_i1.p1 TRINITY_DN10867_c0_g1~~TRINITY_DN10867_c0_g1_i1.p1  ORF type:complete len:310 (-),score=87.15 TRINITY_DN10867_c0_g1_i1:62-991(-)